MEIQVGVVGKALHEIARRKQAARAQMKAAHRRIAVKRLRLEGQHRMAWRERCAGFHHMAQHLGGGRLAHGLAVLQLEGVGVGRNHDAALPGLQGQRLRDQPLVPVRVEVHVRVDLEEPVFARIQRHCQRPRPAWAPRLQRINIDHAQACRRHAGIHRWRLPRRALVDHGTVQTFGPARLLNGSPHGERQHRVAIRGNADEDAHGRGR